MCDTRPSKGLHVRNVLLIAGLLLGASTAMGQSLCVEPTMPVPVDGAAANADQMRAAMADARNFIAQSGVYQACLVKEVEDAKSQASTAGQPFEASVVALAQMVELAMPKRTSLPSILPPLCSSLGAWSMCIAASLALGCVSAQ